MTDNNSFPRVATAVQDTAPDSSRRATCPLCHTKASLTDEDVEAGGDWRCATCGQRWDADRLATVAAYAVWVAEHDGTERPGRQPASNAATLIADEVPLTLPSDHGDAVSRWDAEGGAPSKWHAKSGAVDDESWNSIT